MSAVSAHSEFRAMSRPAMISYAAGDAVVIVVRGPMRPVAFPPLHRLLLNTLGGGRRRLVLDLHEVSKIEPEALALLWGAMRGIRRRGGTLAVAGAQPAVAPALKALKSGGLTLHGTLRAALSDTHDAAPRT
jgi:anti-anti-sigma factor